MTINHQRFVVLLYVSKSVLPEREMTVPHQAPNVIGREQRDPIQ